MRERIIEILKNHMAYDLVKESEFINDWANPIADEILKLGWYPKKFVEWIGKNARINIIKMGIGLNSDGLINHKELNTDELYEYWIENVKNV